MMKINKKKGLLISVLVGFSLLAVGYTALADAATTTNIRIEGSSETVYSGTIEVGDCEVTDTLGGVHNFSGMAICALEKVLSEVDVDAIYTDGGWGLFLDGIGGDITPPDWSLSWSFWVNGQPASVGVDSYEVQTGDEILLTFSAYPTVPLLVDLPDTVTASDPFNIEVTEIIAQWGQDTIIQPAEGATLWVDGTFFTVDATGLVEVLVSNVGEIKVWAESVGKVRSQQHATQVLAVSPPTPSPTPSPSVSPSASPSILPSPSPSPTIIVNEVSREERQQAAQKARQYLRDNQDIDGTIGGTVVSGWSAMAFGASSVRATNVKVGHNSLWDGLSLASLTKATDIERQIMAIRAAGDNPRAWQGRNLVQDLLSHYNSGQFGEAALINDDIFGILALLATDEPVSNTKLRQGVNNIVSWQEEGGSWGNVDLTAAAIQALREYKARGGDINVNQAVEQARDYLKDEQDDDGGFAANSASTAWAIQAIFSLGENPNNWSNSQGKTPWNALLNYQKDNGGISWKTTDDESTFMTAYAVPALLGMPWPIQTLSIDSVSIVESATTTQPSASPSPSFATSLPPSLTPKVAGASSTATTISNNENTLNKTSKTNPQTTTESSVTDNEITEKDTTIDKIDPRQSDYRFAFALFGLVNMGVGVTVARLVMRI